MKQGKLIRRAVSAALAGCMMFTLSAPALAESTDALMQLSMTRRSAVSVLDAENGDTANYGFTIDLNGTTKTVNESNCKDIFEDEKLSYDPTTNKLTNKGTISGELTIDAPNVDVELTGNSFVIYGSNSNLNIKNARNVTLSTNSFSVVGGLYSGNVEINCLGKLTIKNSDPSWSAIQDNLTVHNALEILVEGRFSTVVGGDVKIECACPATFKNNQNGGIAKSITYDGDYVYYTSDATDAEAVDPNVTSIPAETAKYVRIAPKMRYNINTAEDATIKLQGQSTELKTAFAGEKVTVTAAGRENAVFTGWTDSDSVLTSDQLKAKEVTFTMPDKSVTLIPNYKQYYTINSNDTAVIIKVDGTEAEKAFPGQTIRAWAPNKDGWEFEKWNATGVDLGNWVNKDWITFKMPESNVTLNPQYAKLHAIEVVNGTADITSAKEGTKVIVTANHRPGYVFDRWVILEGEAELEDEKNKTATVTVKNTNVKVKAVYKELHGISIEGGSFTVNGDTAETAKMGDAIVATADSAPAGQKFSHWEVTGVDGLTEEQLKNVPLEFTMPRGEVTLKAVFKTLHKIDVKFSTADKDTAIEGETVKITAESRPGYVFDRWEVNNGDVAVAKKNEEETTFVMPDEPVTAVAKYKKLLGITVNSGKAYVEDDVTDAALKGKPVVIKADKIKGKLFDHWKIVSGDVILDNWRAPETKFIMPETAVEITAEYNDLHAITVNNGTANVEEAVIGDTVKIKAESREGYVFDRWEVSYGDVAVANKNAEETTFTMPDSMVVLTARYKALQSITLENGKAHAGGEEITTAKKGTEVAIKADDLNGKVFDHWEIVSGNVTLKNANKAETTFTMPAESISLKAVYNTIHSINTNEFCTADPASAIKGTEITVTAETREGYEFDGWAVSDGVELTEDGKFTMPDHDVTIEAKYKQYHSIEVSKGVATDAEGNPISSAVEGTEIWIEIDREQRNPDEFEFKRWLSTPEDLEIANRKAERTCFTMPDEDVTVEATFLHLREITVHDGTTYVEGEEGGIAKAGQTVTVKADEIPGLKFDHWTVDSENVTLTTVDEATGEATFEMVNEPVELTAHYKAMVTVFSAPAKFSEDTGEESVTEWADVGEKATITAEIDEATFPGMVFDYWEIVTPADLKTENIESRTIEFEVPKSEVKLVAHWKSDALSPSTDPDAPLDPDFDVDPVDDGSGAAGAIVAGAALGGAAVWGGYEIATRVILNGLLPEGAAIPANRGQLALLIWTEKGKPEPAAQPAFADITDAEQAKAAQWCVEQGAMDAKGDCFEPEGWTPKFKVIEVWNKAFPKQ